MHLFANKKSIVCFIKYVIVKSNVIVKIFNNLLLKFCSIHLISSFDHDNWHNQITYFKNEFIASYMTR